MDPFVAAFTFTVLVPTFLVCAFRLTSPFKKPILNLLLLLKFSLLVTKTESK